jgi:hypothetical protein
MVKNISLVPDVIANYSEILQFVKDNNLKFKCRYTEEPFSNFIGKSRFKTLTDSDMPHELKTMILKNTPENEFDYSFIQIQRYEPGDYILPHKDNYVSQLRLFNLTSSSVDGLCIETEDRFTHVLDRSGQEIIFDPQAWHWINPVKKERFSLVIGV